MADGSWVLAHLRHELGGEFGVPIFPEPGGLLGWGTDGGGADYYWDTRHPDSDRWTVMVTGRPVLETPGQYHGCSLTAYLAGLANGSLQAAALGDWSRPNPQIVPVTSPP